MERYSIATGNKMSQIHLYLLGSPRIEVDDQPVIITRRKALALVAYLALADRVQGRATVAALLWPDLDESGARNALRSALPILTQLTDQPWLIINRSDLALNRELVWSDVGAFLAALARARMNSLESHLLRADAVAALEEAVDLYRDHFMAGFSITDSVEYDNWQSATHEWLKREYTQALRRLAEHYSTPDIERAITHALRWLEADPLNENAHRLLMRLYTANGQRAEALRQYLDCVRMLDEQLATPPEDETFRLYEDIRSGNTPLVPLVDRSVTLPAASVLPPLPPLIIGREAALTDIKQHLGLSGSAGRSSTIVIEGWPGVGKSTIIAALAHDNDVAQAFPDGVLWTSLGETPNLLGELTIWGEALKIIPPNRTPKLDELTSQLAALLRDRRMLLIIDDVWQVEHAAPFRVGGQQCAVILCSRLTEVARALAPTADDVYRLPVLTDDFALELLNRLAPQIVTSHKDAALELIHDLEGLPLAIQVAGRLLHEEAQMGWGIADLIDELRTGTKILMAQAPHDSLDVSQTTSLSVTALLRRSTSSLDEVTLSRFALLGLFVPKPATFDLEAMAAVWDVDDPRPTVRVLVNRGLLEPVSGGRFQLHALLVMHAKTLLKDAV